MTGLRRTALVVVVPEAERLVGAVRLQHDTMAALGVPAHVTVLHPFTANVDDAVVGRLDRVFARLWSFDAHITSTGRFPRGVVWLDPQPNDRFAHLLGTVQAAIPECPPYGGAFAEPVPHLTVASGVASAVADLVDSAMTDALAAIPLRFTVRCVTLLEEAHDLTWTVGRSWRLREADELLSAERFPAPLPDQ